MLDSRIATRIAGSFLLIVAAGLAGLATGWFVDDALGWAVFSVILLGMLAYHLGQLYAMGSWLEGESEEPRARGSWDELHALIHRSRREAGKREAGLARALTRWREAARALPDGVVILEGERIEWCNDTAQLHLEIDPVKDA